MQNPHPGAGPASAGMPAPHLQFKGPWLPWTRRRLLVLALVTAGYAVAFSPLYHVAGSMAAAGAVVPAVAAGWLLGMVPGALAGLILGLGGNLALFLAAGQPPAAAFSSSVLNLSVLPVVLLGAISGWMSEVRGRSRLLQAWQEQQQEVLRRQNEYYSALHEMALALVSRLGPQELLQTIVARAGALVGTAHGYVFWRERGQPDCVMRVGVGVYSGFVGTAAKPGQGLAGTVLQTGEPLVINDYLAWPGRLPDPSRDVLRAVVGVPMKSDNEVVGVIGLAHLEKDRRFGPEELEVLSRFAQLATLALDNAQLYASARQELAERQRAERDLRRASHLLDLVIDNLPIMLFVKDARELRVVRWNKAAEQLAGLTQAEVLGKNDRDLFPGGAEALMARDREVLAGKRSIDIPEETIQTRTKGLRSVHTRKIPILGGNNQPQYLLEISEDITDQLAAQETGRRANAYLGALHETSLALLQHLDTPSLLENIVSRAGALVGTGHGYVYLHDPATGRVEMRVGVGVYARLIGAQLSTGVGLAGQVYETGKPLAVDDYRYWPERLKSSGREALRSVVGVPLKSADKVIGVIGLAFTDEEHKFGEAEVEVLTRFADLASLALENARLFEQTQAALAETRRAAEREALLAAINDRLHAGTEVKTILRTAVEELRRSTGARRAVVTLARNGPQQVSGAADQQMIVH